MQLDRECVESFAAPFRGRTDAYGVLEGRAIHRQVTLRRFFVHLQGRDSLGIYPLLDDGTCCWACVDIDRNDIETTLELAAALHRSGLNRGVYVERSRSKGWHVWVFFDRPVLATDIRRVLKQGLRLVGLPLSTEIFPKRDRLTPDTPLGNYVNLPYFGGDQPDGRRMVVDQFTLEPIPWLRFVREVLTFPADALSLVTDAIGQAGSAVEAGSQSARDPGWLADVLRAPVEVGSRRPSVIQLAGALRAHGIEEETAVLLILPWAASAFLEPLPSAEVEKHVRGIYQRYGTSSLNVLERRAHSIARQLGARP